MARFLTDGQWLELGIWTAGDWISGDMDGRRDGRERERVPETEIWEPETEISWGCRCFFSWVYRRRPARGERERESRSRRFLGAVNVSSHGCTGDGRREGREREREPETEISWGCRCFFSGQGMGVLTLRRGEEKKLTEKEEKKGSADAEKRKRTGVKRWE
jgi:hypothetical protein